MSDRLVAAVGIEIYLHHREPFAKLLNAGVGQNIPLRRAAKEIDVEIDGDRERHRPDGRKNGKV